MTLRSVANELTNHRYPVFVRESLPDRPRTTDCEKEITEKFGLGGILREPPDLGEIQKRLIGCLYNNTVEEIERRDFRFAPLCIWYGENQIARQTKLLRALLGKIESDGKRSRIRTLATVYFRFFDESRAGISLVAQTLKRKVGAELPNLYQFNKDFTVFDPVIGPKKIAQYCLDREVAPFEFLRGWGLSGEALTSGFGVRVFRCGMTQITANLKRKAALVHVNQAVSWFDEPGEPLHYLGGHTTLVNTLLLPFREKTPNEEVKNRILEVLLERIGDPRTYPQRWVNMPDAAQVARRWLTRLALRQFLEIVDQVAFQNHWEYRRAFWMALLEKGAISEAWVAFGLHGAERVKREFGKNANFGRLVATWKQVERGHAVLMMRIGDYVAIDWSHNGRCIFWPANDPGAPALYQQEYRSGDIAPHLAPAGGMEISHMSSNTYSWQRQVAEFIRRKTGFNLRDRDYRVV